MKVPQLNPSALISVVEEGYVVYDVEQNRFHELNPSAAFLLELCNGKHGAEEIVHIAREIFHDNAEVAVLSWLAEAQETGLLIENESEKASQSTWTPEQLLDRSAELRDDGYIHAAYVCQQHAVQDRPDDSDQLRELGELAHILGRRHEAREAFERYLKLLPDDAEIQHLLTSLRDETPPQRVPDECIQQLYRRFASFYESNMCGDLGYEGPKHLMGVIDETLKDRKGLSVLDLGCGTGLAGLAVQPRSSRLVGVDLSPEMIQQAADRNIYDELHTAEVSGWMTESTENFDLILACDTFIYFGDLCPILQLAAARLSEDGIIAFSVERAETGCHQLTDNGRYVHHRSHLENAAQQAGLRICCVREEFLRMEYGSPVEGLYVCLSQNRHS